LLRLNPRSGVTVPQVTIAAAVIEETVLPAVATMRLHEPNVLLLDQPEWRLDSGSWQPRAEILRVENDVRAALKLPAKTSQIRQPWCVPHDSTPLTWVELQFRFTTSIPLAGLCWAMEHAELAELWLDDQPVTTPVSGYYVDECILKRALPLLNVGTHTMRVRLPFHLQINLEACYLLGDFSVTLAGRDATLGSLANQITIGDYTSQGLPFYGGNVSYTWPVQGTGCRTTLECPVLPSPVLVAHLDGKRIGPIAFAPWQIDLGILTNGPHTLEIIAYGNRHNTFGPLHHTATGWYGVTPAAWRTTGKDWCDDYQLKPTGLAQPPKLMTGASAKN
jgi:hypothetical protein